MTKCKKICQNPSSFPQCCRCALPPAISHRKQTTAFEGLGYATVFSRLWVFSYSYFFLSSDLSMMFRIVLFLGLIFYATSLSSLIKSSITPMLTTPNNFLYLLTVSVTKMHSNAMTSLLFTDHFI